MSGQLKTSSVNITATNVGAQVSKSVYKCIYGAVSIDNNAPNTTRTHPVVLDTDTTWTFRIVNFSGNLHKGIVYFVYGS